MVRTLSATPARATSRFGLAISRRFKPPTGAISRLKAMSTAAAGGARNRPVSAMIRSSAGRSLG